MIKNACVLALQYVKDTATTSSRRHVTRANSCLGDADMKNVYCKIHKKFMCDFQQICKVHIFCCKAIISEAW